MKSVSEYVASGVRLASKVRGERVIHAKGGAFAATVHVLPAAGWIGLALAKGAPEHSAALRLSRGVGLPDAVPDVLGFALRIYDADGEGGVQDLLLAGSGTAPGLRHLLVPRRDAWHTSYSSVTWCAVGERRLMVGAFPRTVRPAGVGSWFELATAHVRGEWTTFAEVEVGERLSDQQGRDLTFNPANGAGGITADHLTRLIRKRAYPAARAEEH